MRLTGGEASRGSSRRAGRVSAAIVVVVVGCVTAALILIIGKHGELGGGASSSGPSEQVAKDVSTTRATLEQTAESLPVATMSVTASRSGPWSPPTFTARQEERDAMVKLIREFYNLSDEPVLNALTTVPRHEFVPESDAARAYEDSPLPIAYGQLISQPWIVADMTHELQLKPNAKVLEIGTGSGYQAAVLTHFTPNVYSIEIIKPLGEAAAARLKRLGYDAVHLQIADGFNGWPEEAPFDAIIVTCAAGQIPPPLLKQLAPGGRMMIPVGQPFATQSLMLVTKDTDGTLRSQSLAPVRFVPLLQTDPTATAPAK